MIKIKNYELKQSYTMQVCFFFPLRNNQRQTNFGVHRSLIHAYIDLNTE